MAQHDYNIANQTFPNTRTDINNALSAVASNNSGDTAPSTTFANQWFYETDINTLKIRNEDNDGYIEVAVLDQSSDTVEYFKSDSLRTALIEFTDGDDAITIADGGGCTFPIASTFTLGFTSNAASTITTADNTDTLSLISTDTDAAIGPNLNLYRNAGNGVDADNLATIAFAGNDDAGNATDFARITAQIEDASNGSEDVFLYFRTMTGGTERQRLGFDSTSTVFNEEGVSVDFRVESDNNANALIVKGANDRVGIGGADASFGILGVENAGDATVDLFSNVGSGTEGKAEIFFSTDTSSDHLSCASIVMQQDGAGDRKGEIIFNTSDNGGPTARIFISNSGEVIIGSTSNSSPSTSSSAAHAAFLASGILHLSASSTPCLRVNRVNSEGTAVELRQAGGLRGSISVAGQTASFNTSSDYRLKENITYDFNATSRLKELKPARFNWVADENNTVLDGFIAHEVQDVVPESVTGEKNAMAKILYTDDDVETQGDNPSKKVGDFKEYSTTEIDPQQFDNSKLVPLLVKTVQELETRITNLES